ncbi:MAG: GldG family protein [Chloroflexi bacterium]|nr:GldG family protein [Chloroflexota bacterium]
MMKTQVILKMLVPAAAGLGVLFLLAGLGTYLITNNFDRTVLALLAVGAALVLITASYYPQELMAALRGRSAKYGSNTLAMIVIFIVIVGMLNFLASQRNHRWDLTESQEYSLSQQTTSLLARLDEPVKITAFYSEATSKEQIEDLLKEYRRHSDKIDYQFVDPVLKPGAAREYKIQSDATTVLEYKGKREDVLGASEQDITSAIIKLTREKVVKVYFLAGHGEMNIDGASQEDASQLKNALQADNYEVDRLTLATTGSVPSDAGALIIAGPKTPLMEDEKKALQEYLDKGGKALVLLDYNGTDSLNDILSQWGVEVGKGVVIDPGSSLANQPQVPVVMRYGYSPITKDLVNLQQMTLLPLATSVGPTQQPPQGVSVSKIMESSDRSWLATDLKEPQFHEGVDPRGPLSLAVTVEGSTDQSGQTADGSADPNKPNTRLVVIGNTAFASNQLVSEAAIGNRDLIVNSVNWLAEEEDMISIRAKEPAMRTVFLSGTETNFIFYTSVIFLPLALLAIGGTVWWNRR